MGDGLVGWQWKSWCGGITTIRSEFNSTTSFSKTTLWPESVL
jgi:hypothetical protein